MSLFEKRLVWLTGASRGIGWALAEGLARRKARLFLISRSNLDASALQKLMALGAPEVKHLSLDLSERKAREDFLSSTPEPPDVLINNAGQLTGGLLEEQHRPSIHQMMEVNLLSVIDLTQHVLPSMLSKKSGIIVNNASVSGFLFFPAATTYAASKAGVVAVSESLREELHGTGVRVCLMVTPGVKTKMYDEIEGLYGRHLDLSFLSSVSPQTWADWTLSQIEAGQDTIWPQGATRWTLRLNWLSPSLFHSLTRRFFRR